jgi:hypothetical protein
MRIRRRANNKKEVSTSKLEESLSTDGSRYWAAIVYSTVHWERILCLLGPVIQNTSHNPYISIVVWTQVDERIKI